MLVIEKISLEDAALLLLSDDPQEICKIVIGASRESFCLQRAHPNNHREQIHPIVL